VSIDPKSLKFKLWTYFLLFAGIVLAILWCLQVIFINNYYQDMKIRETENAAQNIQTLYETGEFSEIRGQLREIYQTNDMYIEIQTENGIPIYIPDINLDSEQSGNSDPGSGAVSDGAVSDAQGAGGDSGADAGAAAGDGSADSSAAGSESPSGEIGGTEIGDTAVSDMTAYTADGGVVDAANAEAAADGTAPVPDEAAAQKLEDTTLADVKSTPHLSPSVYRAEIENLHKQLVASGDTAFTKQVTDPKTELITLEYAAYLTSKAGDRNVLYIFSPLYPIQSTMDILQSQLIYITIIAMLMAFMISFLISRRISEPIENITKSAERLGEGEYGIVFDGGQYSELTKLADTLTYTSLELAKSDNLQKDVIANVSHDLRTPLTMITSYAEMIHDLSGGDPEKRNAHLQVIIDEAGRLNKLVTDFLEISRMQSGVQEISLTTFSLKELIENTLQAYVGFVEKEGFKLVFISSGSGVIRADSERLTQVINNLVSNAFKYSGRDRTVEVKMFDEPNYVRCEVSDHGIGITKKDLKYIWERYYRASTNYKRANSTGLGLSIVKQILLLHGANFGVESALKKGSTFWFEIKKPTEDEMADYDGEGSREDGANGEGGALGGAGGQGGAEVHGGAGDREATEVHGATGGQGAAWDNKQDNEITGEGRTASADGAVAGDGEEHSDG
jgi:signal transduction histidine kinase